VLPVFRWVVRAERATKAVHALDWTGLCRGWYRNQSSVKKTGFGLEQSERRVRHRPKHIRRGKLRAVAGSLQLRHAVTS